MLTQFVDPNGAPAPAQMLVFGALAVVIGLVSDTTWAMLAGTTRNWIAGTPRRAEVFGTTGGVMMIGLGVQLAIEDESGGGTEDCVSAAGDIAAFRRLSEVCCCHRGAHNPTKSTPDNQRGFDIERVVRPAGLNVSMRLLSCVDGPAMAIERRVRVRSTR